MREAAALPLSYLCGAIPFSVIISRVFYGTDIRQHGSGNAGATNVWRVLGAKPGAATLALDMLKGLVPVLAARAAGLGDGWALACGVAAIAGHTWSVFIRFKGGKGVATSAGVFFALVPGPMLVALVTFAAVFGATRRVSAGSIAAAMALSTAAMVMNTPLPLRAVIVVVAALVIFKHRSNIRRIMDGTEPRAWGDK